jgi:hypothetical protein
VRQIAWRRNDYKWLKPQTEKIFVKIEWIDFIVKKIESTMLIITTKIAKFNLTKPECDS